jgi:hypothetical protein
MSGMLRRLRGAWLVAGVMTAAVTGGFLSNFLFRSSVPTSEANPFEAGIFKAAAIGATATHGTDSVIMCTGEVDIGIEAVYVLDVVTGELKGGVLNIRTGKFMTGYAYSDVAKDLHADGVKNPKYLMVTGEAQASQGFGANGRFGRSVLYIAEVNSGYCACYGAPWTPARATANNVARTPLVLLDNSFQFRQGEIVRPK